MCLHVLERSGAMMSHYSVQRWVRVSCSTLRTNGPLISKVNGTGVSSLHALFSLDSFSPVMLASHIQFLLLRGKANFTPVLWLCGARPNSQSHLFRLRPLSQINKLEQFPRQPTTPITYVCAYETTFLSMNMRTLYALPFVTFPQSAHMHALTNTQIDGFFYSFFHSDLAEW